MIETKKYPYEKEEWEEWRKEGAWEEWRVTECEAVRQLSEFMLTRRAAAFAAMKPPWLLGSGRDGRTLKSRYVKISWY